MIDKESHTIAVLHISKNISCNEFGWRGGSISKNASMATTRSSITVLKQLQLKKKIENSKRNLE
jgi:hypothetical protein